MSSLAEPARFRRGSRSRPEIPGGGDDPVPQVETITSPADTTSTVRRGADNGFWADLFPGSDSTKDGS